MRRVDRGMTGAAGRASVLPSLALMLVVLGGLAILTVAPSADAGLGGSEGSTTTYAVPRTACEIDDKRAPEISGAVASEDGLVVANDKGARLLEVDRGCAVTRVTDLLAPRQTSVPNPARLDVEDLAEGPDGTIWLVDSGGNRFRRTVVRLVGLGPDGTVSVRRFRYPDGPHDAEAAVVTLDSRLVLLTKQAGTSGVYIARLPGTSYQRTVGTLRRLGALDLTQLPGGSTSGEDRLVTGAALSPDGLHVALRTYTAAYEWTIAGGDVARSLLSGTPRLMAGLDQKQGEAIAYQRDGSTLLALSEQLPAPVLAIDIERSQRQVASRSSATPTWLVAAILVPVVLLLVAAPGPRRLVRLRRSGRP